MDDDVSAVVAAAAWLGPPEDWEQPSVRSGLGLAVLESVWSIGVRAEGVSNVIARYSAARAAEGGDAAGDTPADLADLIERLGGPEAFAEHVRNRQRTSTRGGILKAEAVLLEARMLRDEGVRQPADLQTAEAARLGELSARWAAVPGQASLVSWRAFLMAIGRSEVKPDRMIRRFLARALDRPSADAVAAEEARLLVHRAAERLGLDPRTLDLAIWSYQRARDAEPTA
jgi:hypothetical protein